MKRFIEKVYFPERCPLSAVSFTKRTVPIVLQFEKNQIVGWGRVYKEGTEVLVEVEMLSYIPWVTGKTILGANGPISQRENGEVSKIDIVALSYLVR